MITTKKTLIAALSLSASLFLTGCQTSQSLYHWGGYEQSLYEYYKAPAEQEALAERLLALIENESARIPPGIYAEYGTLLLRQGKTDEAIVYFKKEKEQWPESQILMDSMINALSDKQGSQKKKDVQDAV